MSGGQSETTAEPSRSAAPAGRVGVLGCGLMGAGIAEVCLRAGFETVVREVSSPLLDKGLGRLRASLARGVERGKLGGEERDAALARLRPTTDLADLAGCEVVVEAIVEDLEQKRLTVSALDTVVGEQALLASNTSSLTITGIATASRHPERVVGLHFFNPVPVMRLVEVVRTMLTSEAAWGRALDFVRRLGKEPVACRDNSGFMVNRLLVPYLLDAIRAHEEGVGSIEDLDKAMQLGAGYPMGPFTLLDFVGLDTTLAIAEIMFDEHREKRFAPPRTLRQLVQAGRLGRKSGRGFHEYP